MDRLPKHLYFPDGAENDVETLFILESPYEEELYWEHPCMGQTGKKMSEVLIQHSDIAIGDLIQHNNPQTRKYALFETFKFPLDESLTHGLDADELFWKHIKCLDSSLGRKSRDEHNQGLNNFWEENKASFPKTYQICLESSLKLFSNLKEIVVCGFIAQSIFLNVFQVKDPGYDQDRKKILVAGKTIDIYFIEHPSAPLYDNNRPWAFRMQPRPLGKIPRRD